MLLADEFSFDLRDKTCVCPVGQALRLRKDYKVNHSRRKLFFEGRLTDCRSCHLKEQCMKNPDTANGDKGHGRQVSMTYKVGRTATDWMKRRVDSQRGKTICSHRMSVVEPVFGNICANKGLSRFSLRGKEKVQGQWRLFCLVHNLEKVMRYGALT